MDELEEPAGNVRIRRQLPGALDRLVGVRDDAAAPAAELVPEDPEAGCAAAADSALGNDAALGTATVPHRSLLDHVGAFRQLQAESSVVEGKRVPPLEPRDHPLVDAPVQPHRVPAGAERQPVELDAGSRLHVRER